MHPQINRQWILKSRPKPGPLSTEYFELKEGAVSELRQGEILLRNRTISFDPTQRFWMERDTYMPAIPLGEVMKALSIAEVVASRNPQYAVGA